MAVSVSKQRMDVYLHPETIEKVKELYGQNDCRNRSEFIEKAGRSMVETKLSLNAGVSFLISMVIFFCISVHLAFAENEKGRLQMNESTATGLW